MKRGVIVLALVSSVAVVLSLADQAKRVVAGNDGAKEKSPRLERRGYTGPQVPVFIPVLGDYAPIGVRKESGRTDFPRLLSALEKIGARDYFHLVWGEENYPGAWDDFAPLAAEFHKRGWRLWLYLTPPSEPPAPEPFGFDYLRWAEECAKLAALYPSVAGICIDDFNGNVDTFTPAYCREIMARAHKIAPHLALLVICYFGYYEDTISVHVQNGAIDGVVFPYFYPQKNHSDPSLLRPQIEAFRRWLDEQTRKGGLAGSMPLVVMVYATKHSQSVDEPTPAFIERCLEIGLEATQKGLADGVVTYCLPKSDSSFVDAVARVYRGYAKKMI